MPDGNSVRTVPAVAGAPFSPFSPRTLESAMSLAAFLYRARTLPAFLRDNPADMLLVIEQAARWQMSPFYVAQCAYSLHGKLGFESKLIHAAIESSPLIVGYIDYTFTGTGDDRTITVAATRRGETEPRAVSVRLGDARTSNEQWRKQPDQMLCYHGVRVWARRYAASVLAGVYAPEEFDALPHSPDAPDAAIPRLDAADALPEPCEAAAPGESTPGRSLRDAINAAIPLHPKKPTVAQWLSDLQDKLATCESREEVEAAILCEDVCRASRTLQGDAKQRLRQLINAALARYEDEA